MFKKINPALFSILFVNFIGTLGFSLVIPFLVILVTKFGGNAFVYGVVGSIYPVFQLIGSPLLGNWSDKFGRKPILLLSQLGTLIAWFIFIIALFVPVDSLFSVDSKLLGIFFISTPLIIVSLARALDGITGGNITVAQAYLADITTEENRNKNFGKLSVSSNLGFIIGPALAGLLGGTYLAEKIPVAAAIIISLAATVYIAKYLPESHAKHEALKHKIKFSFVFSDHKILYMLVIYFVVFLGFNIFYTSFPIHAITTLRWSVGEMGIYFSLLSGALAAVQVFILPKAAKRFSDKFLISFGSIILAINFILLYSNELVSIYAALIFFAVGNGLMWPSILSHLSKMADDAHQGTVQGLSGSAAGLASIVGLIGGGLLYDKYQNATFLISAGIIVIVFAMSLGLYRFQKNSG